MRFEPPVYQQRAIQRILEQTACGLFLDMGLGKTVITLTAVIELLHDRFDVSRVLVIAPLRVAQSVWTDEAVKWQHTRYLRISRVLGSQKQRVAALDTPADIWIINRENTEWLVDYFGRRWPFDAVIIDELSSFKSSRARRFRALRKVRPLVKWIVGLTGTPAPNGLLDLWSQVYLLDGGERLGRSIRGYRERFFEPGKRDPSRRIVYSWVPKPEAEKAIYRKLADLCVSMRAEDWLQVPEQIDRTAVVQLPPGARKMCRRLERDMLLPFVSANVVASTAAVLSNKLLQLANGAVYDDQGQVQWVHDAKLDALEDLIEAANGNPVLVYYTYRHDYQRLRARFPQAVLLDTPESIKAWNDRRTPILLAHPASAGHGLNLQTGGNNVIWFGLPWSLELYQQGNGRVHRQGQTERVTVWHLVVKDSMDENVMRVLAGKAAGQDALLEAVRARIAKVA
ncbi:MAG: DEAD/DEAH box helicase [Dehalococcoidia bacterium]|nr:DEAD/DEAH box helicase [Dehalococcoidia bacterium]